MLTYLKPEREMGEGSGKGEMREETLVLRSRRSARGK